MDIQSEIEEQSTINVQTINLLIVNVLHVSSKGPLAYKIFKLLIYFIVNTLYIPSILQDFQTLRIIYCIVNTLHIASIVQELNTNS